eukprot:15450991-Alexandrium_andersonii.AAC.1
MAVADLLSVLQVGRLDASDSWPAVAEFSVGRAGEGRSAALHAPLERWSGELRAVFTFDQLTEPFLLGRWKSKGSPWCHGRPPFAWRA